MELREGMYIRSKDKRGNQFVRRIVELPTVPVYGSIVVDKDIHNVKWVSKKNVLKASNSIIDLIEVGDYVNGYKVSFKDNDYAPFVQCDYPVQEGTTNHYRFYSGGIANIVTKEQFENMKYGVK